MTKREWWHMMDDVEGSKWFKIPVNILFWFSIIVAGFCIPINYKISFYIIGTWVALILCVYWPLFLKKNPIDAFSEFVNVIDDPIDDLKHKIHGATIFGYKIYLPSWLMGNNEEDNNL